MAVNKVFLMGRLTKDPELRTTQSGVPICRFSVAVDRYSKGEEKQADFFDVTAWRQTAEFVCKYFTKGRMIHIEGDIQNNNYTDNNGVKHYSVQVNAQKVDFCGDKQNDPASNQYRPSGQYAAAQGSANPVQASTEKPADIGDLSDFEPILDDGDVPF